MARTNTNSGGSGGSGTVTQVNTTGPLTGGPITTSGTIGITKATISTDGYLSSTDWNTFNNKGNGTLTHFSFVNVNGFSGIVSNPSTTPTLSLSTTATGILQGLSGAISAITVGTGLNFSGGTLSATGLSSTLLNTHLFVGNSSNVAVDGGANYTIDNVANDLSFAPISGIQFQFSNTNDTAWLAEGAAGFWYTGPGSTGLLTHKGFGIDLKTGTASYTMGDSGALMGELEIDNIAFTNTLTAGNGTTAAMNFFQDAGAHLSQISDEANRIYLSIDKGNNLYQIGDISTSGNGLKLSVDDAGQAITAVTGSFGNFTVQDTSGNRLFNTAAGSGNVEIGDIDGNFAGYTFVIDQGVSKFFFNGANFQINGVDYIMPNTQGTTGQSLTIQGVTAGVGTLDWETVGGGGAPIYPNTFIPFGDGTTPGGITDANFIYDPANALFKVAFPGLGTVIDIDNLLNIYKFGDTSGTFNNTNFIIDDSVGTYTFNKLPTAPTITPLGFVTVDSSGQLGIDQSLIGGTFLIGQTSGLISNPSPIGSGSETWLGQGAGNSGGSTLGTTFIGIQAGGRGAFDTSNANHATFVGDNSGVAAQNAAYSTFIGHDTGVASLNAAASFFMGQSSGNSSPNANNAIFIGNSSGAGDTVNNQGSATYTGASGLFQIGEVVTDTTTSGRFIVLADDNAGNLVIVDSFGTFNGGDSLLGELSSTTATLASLTPSSTSILIGDHSSTNGFSNSVGIGNGVLNGGANQFLVDSPLSPFTLVQLNSTTGQFFVGDTGSVGNSTTFKVDDAAKTYTLSQLPASPAITPIGAVTVDALGQLGVAVVPIVVASADLTAQTTAVNPVVQYTVGATDGTYTVGGYITITAINAGSLNLQVIYTDETSTVRTKTIVPNNGSLIATGVAMYPEVQIHAQAGSVITLLTTFGGVSVTYNVGGTIEYMGH